MDQNCEKIKKIGNKITVLSRKIDQSQKLSLQNRTFGYFEELEKCNQELSTLILEIKKGI